MNTGKWKNTKQAVVRTTAVKRNPSPPTRPPPSLPSPKSWVGNEIYGSRSRMLDEFKTLEVEEPHTTRTAMLLVLCTPAVDEKS